MSISFNQLNASSVSDANGNTTLGTFSSQKPNGANNNNNNNNNTAVGFGALRNNGGDHNVALGLNALANNTGSNNLAIGENALHNFHSASTQSTGNGNIAIGNNALGNNNNLGSEKISALTGHDNVAIGHNTDAGANSSCILLGNGATTKRDSEIGIGGINSVVLSTNLIAGYLPIRLSNTLQQYYIPTFTGNEQAPPPAT